MLRDARLLLIDDDPRCCHDLAVILEFLGESFLVCQDEDVLGEWRRQGEPVLSCLLLGPRQAGHRLRLLRQLGGTVEHLPILLFGDQDCSGWPDELRHRVLAHLDMPPSYSQLTDALHRVQVYRQVYDRDRERGLLREPNLFRSLVGTSRAIQEVREQLQQVAQTECSVLLLGEPGSGKEVVARNLHYHSPRREQPFVPFNCAAIDASVLEGELFGYQQGAFPGALHERAGRLEMAAGGTLFLDEVGCLPPSAQGRLQRLLQEGCFERLGDTQPRPLDVRIVAASQPGLEQRIAGGQFANDLYYRLSRFTIELPPLRERVEDIPLLINELTARLEHERRGSIRFSSSALLSLCQHDWRGNVRELANLVERLAIMHPYGVIGVSELPRKYRYLSEEHEAPAQAAAASAGSLPGLDSPMLLPVGGLDLKEYLGTLEQVLIQQAMDDAGGVVARAAERLRLRRTTLVEKMRKYGMQRRDEEGES